MRAQTRVIPGPTVTLSMAAHELSLDGAFESRSVPVIYDLTGDTDSEPEKAVVSHPLCVAPPFLPLSAIALEHAHSPRG